MERKPHRQDFDQFWKKRTHLQDKYLATHFKKDTTHTLDLAFIEPMVNENTELLDLGAGTCVVSSKLAQKTKSIIAIDKFDSFLNESSTHKNLTLTQSDVLDFQTEKKFDLILLFGVITYFDKEESTHIYSKCSHWLKPNGKLLIKHQCGKHEDLFIDKYSQQIGSHYKAFYRKKETEEKMLRKYFNKIDIIDIYPPENNPWEDSYFYAFVCEQPKIKQ